MAKYEALYYGVFWIDVEADSAEVAEEKARELESEYSHHVYNGMDCQINQFIEVKECD